MCARLDVSARVAHHSPEMSDQLAPGLTGEAMRVVTQDLTATALGSGDVDVFGTPALLALIEEACCAALHAVLDPVKTSVGMRVDLEHLAPSRVGAQVRAIARLTEVDRHRLTFEAEAFDDDTLIGRATHTRAIIDRARFD